ncbi:MAG: homoserine dehydrogenase [Candidatus Omnitrophica bacterium]|nr:homoserine dehydrogenase [Candidatus Omnitrophota bacterium]
MNKVRIGLIGYGNVGSGVVKFLRHHREYFSSKFPYELVLKAVCDRRIHQKLPRGLGKVYLTKDVHKILADPEIDVIVELIGGLHPAKEIVLGALKNGKHVITANKQLIANHGKDFFQAAHKYNRNIYFESSVMAGVPLIKMVTEGIAGNQFHGLYGIINGTCNYILSEMTRTHCTFEQALAEAQRMGYAESNPAFDINGTDSAHKLAILVSLTLGKFITQKDIHTEGITHISHDDIEYAESLGLAIKLLGIAKKSNGQIEARVHPTLISQEHPVASINGIFNAIFIDADPLGDILLSGQGAGQMAAASGVISDLMALASRQGSPSSFMLANLYQEDPSISIKKIDEISTEFYLRFMAKDKPGVLAQIAGILAQHGVGINSVTQRAHNPAKIVPLIILTEPAPERELRLALNKIYQLPIVAARPVAIRMENLPSERGI